MLSLYPVHVSFPLTVIKGVECSRMEVLRRLGSMDAARVTLKIDPRIINQHVSAGNPIQIEWSDQSGSDSFFGYVHSYRETNDEYSKYTELLAVGASYPMVNSPNRAFFNVGIHTIAEQIADDHRFNLDADAHRLVRQQVLQVDQSDWALLQRLSEEWGYVLLFEGVTIIFRDLKTYLEDQYPHAEVETVQGGLNPETTSIKYFKPSYSAQSTVPVALSTGYGVEPTTGKVLNWREPGTGVFAESETGRPVLNIMEAEYVAAVMNRNARFPFYAEARVVAPFGKKPLDMYNITHQGRTATWAILTAKHVIVDGEYEGEFILGSDSEDYVTGLPTIVPPPKRMRLSQFSSFTKSEPYIVNSKPFYRGNGGNVLMEEQRWKARVMGVYIGEAVAA